MTKKTGSVIIIAVGIVVIGAMSITAIICGLNGTIFALATGIVCLLCGVEIKAVIDFFKEAKDNK